MKTKYEGKETVSGMQVKVVWYLSIEGHFIHNKNENKSKAIITKPPDTLI